MYVKDDKYTRYKISLVPSELYTAVVITLLPIRTTWGALKNSDAHIAPQTS